uniref:Ion transport domain-containing protein n=1 Tax=Anopheles farauti TaxID=69004 RepID=A0A182Q6U6_9DIPT
MLQYNEVNVDEMWNGKSALDCYLERTSNNNFEEIDKCVQELLKHHAYMNIDNLTTFLKNLSNNYEPNFVIIFISLYDRNFIDAYKASKHKIELCLEALHEKVLNNDLWKLQNTLHESEDLFSQEYQAIINSDNETISYLLEVCIARRYIKAAKTIISAKLTAANEMQNRADLYDWLPKRVLTRCCQVGNFQMLKYLFHNFDGNVYNQYLISDSIELLQLLVRKIDPTRENCPYLRCLELCLNNPAIDIDEVDGKNCSALHYAGMFKLTKVQKLLLQKGAYLGGMDDNGASTMAAIDPTVLADFFDTCMFNNGETFKSLDYHIVIKLNNFVPPKYKIKQLASENETQVLVQDERRVANSSGTNEQADELQNGSSPIQPLAQDNVEQPELVNIQEPNSNTSTQVPVEDDNSAANTSGTDEQADELQNGSSPIQPLAQHNIQQPELGNIQEPNSSTSTQVPVQDERIGVNSLGTDEQAVELLNGSSSMQPSVNGNIEQYELKMFPKSNTFSQGQTKQTAKRNETSKTNHVSYKSIIPALAEFTDASKISKLCSADQNARHMLIDHPIILILTLLREPISTNYATWLMIALKLLPLSIFFIVVPFDHNKNNFWFMLGIGITFCCRLSYTLLESRYIIWIPFTKILIRKEEKKKILSLLLQRHVWTRLVEIFVLIYSLGLIFIDSDYTNVYTIVTLFAGYEVTQCLAGFDRFSEPIYMLVVVVKVVLKNLLLFAYIFVTFAFSFFVVFRLAHPTTSSVALGEIENFNNSDYKTNDSLGNSTISLNISQKQEASHVTLPLAHDNSYDSPESNLKQWLLKVIVMYIGEINADRFGFEKNFNYMVVGVFVLYLAVVCISLANMITGLAVNNISMSKTMQ